MTPQDYERYVSELVRQLSFCRSGHLYRNKKYKGVRQPGDYEIDVSVEFSFDGKLSFLLIVECKNWRERVNREVVQKLAQTRDAISAHKAAVVSPVGFTRGARDLAATLGIALWVISEVDWIVVSGLRGPPRKVYEEYVRREAFLQKMGFTGLLPTEGRGRELLLMPFSGTRVGKKKVVWSRPVWSWNLFRCSFWSGGAMPTGSGTPGFDTTTASTQIIDEVARAVSVNPPAYLPGKFGGHL